MPTDDASSRNVPATTRNTASPWRWPWLSLTCLKSSTSMTRSEIVANGPRSARILLDASTNGRRVMRANHRNDVAREIHVGEHFDARHRMTLHELPLVGRQLARLVKDL